jgi:hypothetical protein
MEEGAGEKAEERTWRPTLHRVSSATVRSDVRRIEAREDRRTLQTSVIFERDRRRTLEAMESVGRPVNLQYLRDLLGINGVRMSKVISSLVDDGLAAKSQHEHNNRPEMRYSLGPGTEAALINGAGCVETEEASPEN